MKNLEIQIPNSRIFLLMFLKDILGEKPATEKSAKEKMP